MNGLDLKIDKEKCTKCGLCAKACDMDVIFIGRDGYPRVYEKNSGGCLKCQHCFAACPTGAFSIFGKKPDNSVPARAYVKPEDMLGLIKTRRSCRHFKHENIQTATLNNLKNMLAWAPTGCNDHGLYFAVIDDAGKMKKFVALVNGKLIKILKLLPPFGRIKEFKEYLTEGRDVIFRNAPHMIVACVSKKAPCKRQDPVIALSYFELYANTLGIGTLWCGFATVCLKLFPSLRRELGIPGTHKVGYVMMFGVPALNFERGTQPEPYPFSKI